MFGVVVFLFVSPIFYLESNSVNPLNFTFLGKPLLGEKYVEAKKKENKKERIMPSLVATTSASERTSFGCMHSAQTNFEISHTIQIKSLVILIFPVWFG